MEFFGFIETIKDRDEVFARLGLYDELPGIAGVGAFVEGRHWRGESDLFYVVFFDDLVDLLEQFLCVFDGCRLCFIGN